MSTSDPENTGHVPQSLEDGLDAGFGPPEPDRDPAPSVVERLAKERGIRTSISLREAPSALPSRVLRPLGPAGANVPKTTGKYQLQGEIARGGVGVVLRGHDVDLGRDVAMKILHEKYLDNSDLLQRFIEEAQIAGQLQHPGIVPVYDLGLTEGRPYFTMKLIKGRTLAALLTERDLAADDRRRLLGVFEQTCQTVAYAHARGVIHRDLKPANVMVGAFGEIQVVDWGMGKVLFSGGIADEARAQKKSAAREVSVIETVRSQPGSVGSDSVVGSVMGTPAYMPPEQANGQVDRMDERSDVFSLGAILCEILTGAPPYAGEPDELLAKAAKAELDPCHERLNACDADDELRQIARDCLLPVPAARPRSAEVVAERITRYLSGVEERARAAQIEAAEQRVQAASARRAQRLTIGLTMAVLAVVVLAVGGWWWIDRDLRARQAAAAKRVADALDEVDDLLGRARSANLDELRAWDRAAAAAAQAVALAEFEDVPADRREEARSMAERIANERASAKRDAVEGARHERIHERITLLRITPDEDVRGTAWLHREALRLERAYDEAFAEFFGGSGIAELAPGDVVAGLRESEWRVELATALDHWAVLRDYVAPDGDMEFSRKTAKLREIAARADVEDPWRNGLRSLLPAIRSRRTEVERLAAEADISVLPAVNVVLLGEALWMAGSWDRAIEVYRLGREYHAGDLGICLRLGILLERLDEPPLEEIVHMLHLANALRPDLYEVKHRLGMALRKLGQLEESLRIFEHLCRKQPDDQHLLRHVAWALEDLGRDEEVKELDRRIHAIDPRTDWGRYALLRLHSAQNTKLSKILSGELVAASDEEAKLAAVRAYNMEDYALSARTYRSAFEQFPALLTEFPHRYNAARAAALCATGAGRDAGALDETQRSTWRGHALEWLSAEFEDLAAFSENENSVVVERLSFWLRDNDLACIRGESALAALPEPDRAALAALWSAVRSRLDEIESHRK